MTTVLHLRATILVGLFLCTLTPPADAAELPAFTSEPAFPQLAFQGWATEDDEGRPQELRTLLLTHAGDGSQRIFVCTQEGRVHCFDNTQDPQTTRHFLDITDRAAYVSEQPERGLLGLAFHPKYSENGQLYVVYTTAGEKFDYVLSRFTVSSNDPDYVDPATEKVLLQVPEPYWNHNAGTIVFGPDGYLYVSIGDGGLANDPHKHGQDLSTLLATILRIDVDHSTDDRPYAIPADNPFVDHQNVRPEIWAYGLRNVWRMAFDSKTGLFWAGDVGQDRFEEINLIVRGGNYGWNVREGLHPFRRRDEPAPDADTDAKNPVPSTMIDPIWEYDHDTGKSITGGIVYRGKNLPQLDGNYLFADFVSRKIWALEYDVAERRVIRNKDLGLSPYPVTAFGEDEQGEAYYTVLDPHGHGIYRLRGESQ